MNEKPYAMARLKAACEERGPLCVGLDTDPEYLPPEVLRMHDFPADAVLEYNKALIRATGPNAGCFKVQIAYYEAMGLKGLAAYAKTLREIRAAGIVAIADVKRGDIADTAKAYARAHFEGDFEADIVTLNPYMGFETLDPFLEYVKKSGKGAFVLLRTSNPGMRDIEWLRLDQDASKADGCPAGTCFLGQPALPKDARVLDAVGQGVYLKNQAFGYWPNAGCGPVGMVVGCTEESEARALRDRYNGMFFLIPGYGAQGGAARIAATLLSRAGGAVNSSRAILTAWKKDPSLEIKMKAGELTMDDIVESAARAAFAAKAELLAAKKALAENPSGADAK
jgi:orotidine-5'-phosphate decarboxylase